MESIRAASAWIRHGLGWLPEWVQAVLLLAFAITVAILIHRLLARITDRIFSRNEFARKLVPRIRGPIRLALIILAVALVAPTTPLTGPQIRLIGHSLLVAFIVLVGWSLVRAVELGAALYLRRYRLDVEDNLLARKHFTQVRILRRAVDTLIIVLTASAALMTFDGVRQYGVSLFASAGAAGLVVGLAAQPVLSNLIAGIQLAITQPIRIEDAVIVEGEYGTIEEITATYVVVRLWDLRRLIVPLKYFIDTPFQNWTREGAAILGTVMLYLDYRAPIPAIRRKLGEIAKASPNWDHRVVGLQVTDAKDQVIELRALVSARNSPRAFDLRCEVREKLIAFLQAEHPEALPRQRVEFAGGDDAGRSGYPAMQAAAE
ncbi:mechanosensitive ion channel family protein [Propylenella binzhouense]|uniref:Mechanosensitive ion channel n=1 Tax=Propylenella binzhouense TaxID=2555902 RepID=A0A964T1F1_9HYPH|nr:mechanosensitive ion channel domain-containing protein [Propylenella binzhouense]MYZ46525.1 mechanosensitive ion channel [Propylenella binzhouense]